MKFILTADNHCWGSLEPNKPALAGDSLRNFSAVCSAASSCGAGLILGGDLFNLSAKIGITEFCSQVSSAIGEVPTVFIQGNHDHAGYSEYGVCPPWLLESPGRQWIGRDPSAVTEFNGLRIGGLDYQRGRERFLEAWQQVPSDLDVLVLHQAYQPLLPFEGVWEVGDEDIIAKNPKVVLIGHVHTPKIFKLPNGTQVVSPGATVLHTFDAPYVRTVPGISEYNGGITYATLENGVVSLETLQARKYVRVDADLVDEQTLDLALANAKALDYPSFFLVDFAVKAGVYQALQERFAGVPTSLRPKGLSTVSLIGERATAGTQRAPIEEVIARHVDRDGYPELFAVCLDIANLESKDPEALRNLIEEHLAKISCD